MCGIERTQPLTELALSQSLPKHESLFQQYLMPLQK